MQTKQSILVVDDNITNVVALRKPLRNAGYEVLTANDGFEAVTVATEQLPDLILLDMMMPGRDGIEVCTILKANETTADIPVIFVTAQADSDKIVSAFSAGGVDYTTKPFRINEILARVSVHLKLREAENELSNRNARLESLAQELANTNTQLAQQSRTDPLTKLLNRGAWEESAQMEHDRSVRSGDHYTIVMIDVDHFKAFNDTNGHPAGDECLRRVSVAMSSACRSIDLVGRYGGEEFVILLTETSGDEATHLGERIRTAIANLDIPHSTSATSGRVTASLGLATSQPGMLLQDVLETADKALYVAKKSGRNRMHLSGDACAEAALPKPTGTTLRSTGTPQTGDCDRASVLIVDDNATNRVLCKGCLAREGYDIREASDGQAAMSAIAEFLPDAIIMDVMMPLMDGLECTRLLKENPETEDIPIIMLSARADASDVLAGLNAGAEEYLTKPIRTKELAVRVRSMVRLRRKQRSLRESYDVRGEQTRTLSVALNLGRALGAANNLDEILEHTISAASEMLGCRRVSIMLPDADRYMLHVAKSMGIGSDVVQRISVKVGDGVSGRVFETGKATVVNTDEERDTSGGESDSELFNGIPMLSTPMGGALETVGVLNISDRCSRQPFASRELEQIDLIAGIAGAAIVSALSRAQRNQAHDSMVHAMAALAEHRDSDTGQHLNRVTKYSLVLLHELARKQGFLDHLETAFAQDLERAVPLHDIGKVAIPDRILLKPGKLDEEEMRVMRTHAQIGADTIREVMDNAPGVTFMVIAEEIARCHHEWIDGTGYPAGLVGDNIPLSARIVAVADVYDALTTKRPYKPPFSHEKAVEIITESSGTQFDAEIVEAFMAREGEFIALARDLADDEPTSAAEINVAELACAGRRA